LHLAKAHHGIVQKRSCMRRNMNQLDQRVAQLTTAQKPKPKETPKDPIAVELGRRGGLKGGKARWANVSEQERKELARKAAQARWHPK
jgi:hypothetical protein